MKKLIYCIIITIVSCLAHAATDSIATLRGGSPLEAEPEAPRLATVENHDIKRTRDYPMEPPTIPHKVDDYQVDLRTNKCLACHSRRRTEESQAPMVSVTHYMDRDTQFLAEISPRRYFCSQCHVVQTDAKPLVENTFEDVDTILRQQRNPE